VLATVTAAMDARGGERLAGSQAMLSAYKPALVVITGVAAAGVAVAISGLASASTRRIAARKQRSAGEVGQTELEPIDGRQSS
jgi:hypothetical protein